MSKLSDNATRLCQRWYDAAVNNINTTERTKLYEDTEKLVKEVSGGNEAIKQVMYDALINGFDKPDQNEKLARWIASNTSMLGPTMEYDGAYPCLHHLFETVTVDPADIDKKSLEVIQSHKGSLTSNKDIENLLYSEISPKDLVAMCLSSRQGKAVAMPQLIDQLNKCKIVLNDLGFNNIADVVNFFGEKCLEIKKLDLQKFPNINDQDIDIVSKFFTDVNQLFLKDAKISNESTSSFEMLTKLTSLNLPWCQQIEDFSFLEKLPQLTSLDLSECWQIKDVSFLKKLGSLTSLDLSSCDLIEDFSFLEELNALASLKLAYCTQIQNFSFLEKLGSLTSLDLSRCTQIKDFSFLEKLLQLTSLDLSGCRKIKDVSFLEKLPQLANLDLSGCWLIEDFSFLEKLNALASLDLTGCTQIEDFSFLEKYPRLREVKRS